MRFVQFKPRLQALITARIARPSSLLCPTSLVTRTFAAAGPAPLALVKELRLASGAPITDCKKALEAEGVDGNIHKAFEWLRKKGQASVMKNNRAANEGLVGVAFEGSEGVIVEVNSETDFVARNAEFQSFVQGLAKSILHSPSIEGKSHEGRLDVDIPSLLKAPGPGGSPIAEELADLVAKIRENISIKRAARLSLPSSGFVASYVHNSMKPNIGTAASLVSIEVKPCVEEEAPQKKEVLKQFGKRLAMHIVAAKPRYLTPSSVPASVLDYERSVFKTQAAASGKPEAIVAKMTEGKLKKFLSEISLLEQPHMIEEGNPKVNEVVQNIAKAQGCELKVLGFIRYQVQTHDAESDQGT